VKPMIFSVDEAFEQLRDEGIVCSFRQQQRKTEPVWIRRTRTGEKEFDAEIVQRFGVNPACMDNIRPYADRSGFADAEAWVEAIRETHGDLSPGYVHVVERIEGDS